MRFRLLLIYFKESNQLQQCVCESVFLNSMGLGDRPIDEDWTDGSFKCRQMLQSVPD